MSKSNGASYGDNWKYRVISLTKGNKTVMGCIVIYALGGDADNYPRVMGPATIQLDGRITCNFQTPDGVMHFNEQIATADEMIHDISAIMASLKLTEFETGALAKTINDWIVEDKRTPEQIVKQRRLN